MPYHGAGSIIIWLDLRNACITGFPRHLLADTVLAGIAACACQVCFQLRFGIVGININAYDSLIFLVNIICPLHNLYFGRRRHKMNPKLTKSLTTVCCPCPDSHIAACACIIISAAKRLLHGNLSAFIDRYQTFIIAFPSHFFRCRSQWFVSQL